MKTAIWTRVSGIALTAGLAWPLAPTLAQAQSVQTQDSAIEQVVVTARKREETDISVPVSISAMTAKQIDREAVLNVYDIALHNPSLMVQNNTSIGGGSISLRGIGTNAGVAGSLDQSVTLDIDGAPIARGNALRVGQYDLDQIQILKGPQALFFGKDSPAGVISFRSKDPTSTFDAFAKLSYEPYANDRFAEFAVSGPITDSLRARLFVHTSVTDGERDNLSSLALGANAILPGAVTANPDSHSWTNHETFVRGTVVYEPNDRLKFRLASSYDRLYGEGTQAFPELSYCPQGKPQTQLVAAFLLSPNPSNPGPGFANPNFGALSKALAVDDCKLNGTVFAGGINPNFVTAPGSISHYPAGASHSEIFINTAELSYKLSPQVNLASVTTFSRLSAIDVDNFTWGPATIPLLNYNNYALQSQFTEELRATTSFSWPINFMIGGFYENAHFNAYSQNTALPPYIFMFYHIPNQVYSGFFQALWNATPKIELAAGVRQTRELKNLDMTRLGVLQPVDHPNAHFSNTSPEATLTWRPTSNLTAYVAYKTGFKSGGYANTVTQPNPAPLTTNPLQNFLFQPETSRGFEGGVKAALFDRTLRIDTTVYSYKYSNLQVSNYTVNAGIPTQEVLNAASARQQGVEVEASYYPPMVPGLRLNADVNYNDSHYINFISPCYVGQSVAEGCNQLLNPLTGAYTSQVLSGRHFTNAPLWVGTLGFSYSRPLGPLRLEVGSDAAFKSSYDANPNLAPGGRQSPSALLNAQIRLSNRNGAWEIGIYGKNLTNIYRSADTNSVPLTGSSNLTGTAGGGRNAEADLASLVNPGRAVFIQLVLRPGEFLKK